MLEVQIYLFLLKNDQLLFFKLANNYLTSTKKSESKVIFNQDTIHL